MTSSPDLSLPLLLERLGREIAGQAEAVRSLHALLDGASMAPEAIRRAQAIDVSSQHLDEISALLGRIAGRLPGEALVAEAVLAPIGLSALRERLAGRPGSDGQDEDFDLF